MKIPSVEKRIRASFPLIRFMQAYVPLPLVNLLLKRGVARLRLGDDLRREAVSADGVPCEWLIPQNGQPEALLLYLHGGGFVFGLTPQHLQMAGFLGGIVGARVLMVDYRLAPAHPFPAALDDCFTAYSWLLQQGYPPENILLAGDSAGGNLTITLLMKLRDGRIPLPAAAACLSPVADLTSNSNPPKGFQDPLLPRKAIELYRHSYVGSNDPHHPLISPLFGDWRGLPPLLVHVGEDEILRQDARRVVELAKSAGVEASLKIYPRMWHVWQINLSLPQAVQSLEEIADFFKAHLRYSPEESTQ